MPLNVAKSQNVFSFSSHLSNNAQDELSSLWERSNYPIIDRDIVRVFSSRTLVAKALKVLIMKVCHPLYFFLPIFFIFQNIIFQVIPSNPVKLFFQKISQFPHQLSQISNFHDNINLEKMMP